MDRHGWSALVAFALIAMVAMPSAAQVSSAEATPAPQKRPNILVVLFDDVGFTGFGAYGGDARTPNIDQLAQSGALFSRYYSWPFCGPSRAMLMTGMDNHQTGMGTLVETVTPDQRALPGYSMVWDDLSPEEKAIEARAMQVNAGMLEAADFHIGRLLEHLKTTGRLENTIVVVTSDNGPESGVTSLSNPIFNTLLSGIHSLEGLDTSPENMGLPGSLTAIGPEWASVSASPFNLYKFYSSEGGLRVPLVISGPGVSAAGVHDAPVHVADLMPTLLDAARVNFDAGALYGRSILPVLSGETRETRAVDESFGVEVSGNAALYRGDWKLVRTALPRGNFTWRLFDVAVDPGETTDLSAEKPELFAEMRAEYEAYAAKTGVFNLKREDYAEAQLFSNLLERATGKYWPYLTGLALAVLIAVYGLFRLLRALFRRIAA